MANPEKTEKYAADTFPLRATGALVKADEPSRVDARRERNTAREANWRAVCKQVDKRDHYRCRACGSPCDPDAVDMLERAHRHHVTFRSKGGQDVASNLCTLCPRCHDCVHVKRTLRIEPASVYGADGPLEFWRTVDGQEFLAVREIAPHVPEKD